jgi:GrpB-like predicted nucleotidyltransferase (UPF0157 family)
LTTKRSAATAEPIRLVPYDPTWPSRFTEEAKALKAALGPWLAGPVEHVGSTAVPGLAAKPVIDIMAAVRDLPSSLEARRALVPLEYRYYPHRPDVMHWFCKPSPRRRTHHLHLVPYRSRLWFDRLAFRDALRERPSVAAAYAALKASLAERHEFDREGYTEAKGDFVRRTLVTSGSNSPSSSSSTLRP